LKGIGMRLQQEGVRMMDLPVNLKKLRQKAVDIRELKPEV